MTKVGLYAIGKIHDPGIQQEPWVIPSGVHRLYTLRSA